MRYGELFAGAGGMSLGLERSGMTCAFHAEIAEFPRRVLRHHWPQVPLLSDVRALSGGRKTAAYMRRRFGGKIDLLAGGSPCQDLSVAGKRAGLAGARSSLFFRQIRLWRVLDAPLCLWENVDGALSSHNGKDFAAVLSAFVGAAVAVPRDGWTGERRSGVVSGPAGVAAWRVLDAQWFGVPQRRARVFVLSARTGSYDPAEILLEPEGVRWNPPTRREAREATAPRAGERVAYSLGSHAGAADGGVTNESHDSGGPVGFGITEGLANTLREGRIGSIVDTLDVAPTHPENRNRVEPGLPCPPLNGSARIHVCATGDALAFGGNRTSGPTDVATARLAHPGRQDFASETFIVGALSPGAHPGSYNGQDAYTGHLIPSAGIPRRLTPREAERLMSWPDDWTNVPDEKGKPASDSVRYRACGNGVVSNVAQWIGERIVRAAS